jgi:hypothetical protein
MNKYYFKNKEPKIEFIKYPNNLNSFDDIKNIFNKSSYRFTGKNIIFLR